MILRPGVSGMAVQRVEEFLKAAQLYNGPIDSSFGGGLESAVKSFQKKQNLPPTGLIDGATWAKMFPGEAQPSSPLAGKPLLDRCLALTGTFETSKYPPDSYAGLTGDFDGMGISFGVCQWNIGQGTLQPLLEQMFEQHSEVAEDIFHEHFDTVKSLKTASLPEQLSFTRSIQRNGQLNEPWKGLLTTLGRTPEFQSVQASHASGFFDRAVAQCGQYGLTSERAVALLFDIITQNGSIGNVIQAAILADFSQLKPNDPELEVLKMRIVANRRAAAANPKFIDDVRTRKLTIANGAGVVHGLVYDLEDMYDITLKPFGQGATAATV